MIDSILLNITHSDDYTDYLFMTAWLTNKRIIPLIQPSQEEIKAHADNNTLVIRCVNSRQKMEDPSMPVAGDELARSLRVFSRFYLDDDGTLRHAQAEFVRNRIQFLLTNILFSPANLRAVFRHYFPLFWMKRNVIYSDPRLFFTLCRYSDDWPGDPLPLGATLKAMEDDPKTFSIRLGGGCSCSEKPLLVDAEQVYGEHWTIYTWCPACHARREIRAWNFQRAWTCERAVADTLHQYDKGQGLSTLSLFDVIDALTTPSCPAPTGHLA